MEGQKGRGKNGEERLQRGKEEEEEEEESS